MALTDPQTQCGDGTLTNRASRLIGSGRPAIISDALAEAMFRDPRTLARVRKDDEEGRLIIQRGHASLPDCAFIFGVFPGTLPGTTPPLAVNVAVLHKVGIIDDADFRGLMSGRWTEGEREAVRAGQDRALTESERIHIFDAFGRPSPAAGRLFDFLRDNVARPSAGFIQDAADKVLPDVSTLLVPVLTVGAIGMAVIFVATRR